VKRPSPGFNLDSFFQITYRVDYDGSKDAAWKLARSRTILMVLSNVTVLDRGINISAVIDSIGDAFGTKEKKEYLGHVTLLR